MKVFVLDNPFISSPSPENDGGKQNEETMNVIMPFEFDREYFVEQLGEIPRKPIYSFFKRLADIVFSFLLVVLLFVPMVIIGVIVKFTSKGSVLYFQERLGLGGRKFKIIKFRTMDRNAEENGAQWSEGDDDERITGFGRFLRKTRLDELPQLWCILIGTMSFVGPRPERECFCIAFEKYVHGFSERLKVKPGLTGLAQINGGYDLRPEEKVLYDVEYIKKRSLWLDFKIVVGTFTVVFHRKGAK